RHSVEIDGARAAVRRFAADVRARVLQLFAQRVDKELARLDRDVDVVAVQLERHHLLLRHDDLRCSSCYRPARECAVRRAIRVISPAIAVLYSGSPRRSATGSQMLIASRAASSTAAASNVLPRSAASASFALSAVAPTLVSAIATSATAEPCIRIVTAAAAVAKSPVLRFSFA